MNIAIVGSAKLGFSPSPKKNLRDFQDESDIDIIVVSSELYRKSWHAFNELAKMKKIENYQKITSEIFRHFVSLKKVDTDSSYFLEWEKKVQPFKRDLQTVFSIDHDINYRIYESWEWAESYHINGILDLINSLGIKNETI